MQSSYCCGWVDSRHTDSITSADLISSLVLLLRLRIDPRLHCCISVCAFNYTHPKFPVDVCMCCYLLAKHLLLDRTGVIVSVYDRLIYLPSSPSLCATRVCAQFRLVFRCVYLYPYARTVQHYSKSNASREPRATPSGVLAVLSCCAQLRLFIF